MSLPLYAPVIQTADNGYGEGGAGSKFSSTAIHLALLFTIVGTSISLFSVWLHWKNYRKPVSINLSFLKSLINAKTTRINNDRVPVYGISTFISLVSLDVAFYVDTFRDIYEAFVIYAFFNLLLNKLGGERELIIMLHSRPPSDNFFPGTLWSREIYVGDPYTFLFVKRGILQFVYVKPILAVITMILKVTGNYEEGDFSWSSSYLYLTLIYNISVSLTLWALMVFFYATKKDLTGFSVVIALMVSAGLIASDEHISVAIQDFLVCIEMAPAAIAHSYAFSYEDYYDPNVHSARMPIYRAIRDSFGLKDVLMDSLDTLRGSRFSYRSFEPSEGVPHIGSSRTSRIMAGLRYSTSTAKKHWLEPAPASRFLSTGRGMNEEIVIEEAEPLEFDDPIPSDQIEELFRSSRTMMFGDYNYPVIDFRIPLWKQVRNSNGGYGTVVANNKPDGTKWSRGRRTKGKSQDMASAALPSVRKGCIDVVVEQGKGNYVLVDTIHESGSDRPVPSVKKSPRLTSKRSSSSLRSAPAKLERPPRPSRSTPLREHVIQAQNISTQIPQEQIPKPQLLEVPQPYQTYEPSTHYNELWQWPDQQQQREQSPSFNEEDDAYLTGNVWK
ncbi:hypothetical protein EC973_008436 [Apophysomyces ossiformis]|uniref:DUF300-domain-containing protein n=1 Tax=Apophysomyces ossiformis TaxID=679940 RepID=A0A8H7BNK0_9FUNG|nr:hypothetical protein EC973_008436 [Apophysomyces ossiformis]